MVAFLSHINDPSAGATFATMLLLLPFLIMVFYSFNRLVSIQRLRFRERWQLDGLPRKWFASEHQLDPAGSFQATVFCTLKWLFSTPSWARSDRGAHLWITLFRVFTVIWNVGALAVWLTAIRVG